MYYLEQKFSYFKIISYLLPQEKKEVESLPCMSLE